VDVYSNCREVELFLNGKSLGSKQIADSTKHPVWQVGFEPGTIRAVAKNAGVPVATNELRTAGAAARIHLTANAAALPADYNHVCRVLATVVDANGITVPSAAPVITFAISGPGVIAAVDNADNASPEPFQAGARKAAQGWCVAFVKAAAPSGTIALTASAPGLPPATLSITATK
jgi:beta-galactosidase